MEEITALVAALILEHPLCMPCLLERTGERRRKVRVAIDQISKRMILHREDGRCRSCEKFGPILYFGRLMAS